MMVRKPNEKEMTMGEGKAVLAVGAIMVDMLCQVPRLPRSGEGIVVEESRAVVGGCAFNAANVLRQLGAPYELFAPVGCGIFAGFVERELRERGLEAPRFDDRDSGGCMCFVEPGGERTMVTHLGAALELSAGEIEPSIFEGYDCLYVEGYLVQNHDLILKAARTAKKCGLKVAIDLASFNIVAENLEFLRGLVSEHVDIVFANEDEAKTFTCEAEPLNALQAISQMCELAVVKIGTKGALIKQGEEVVHVGIMAAAKRVDTTGAGDFYAAGFLAGLCDGLSLRQCGTIGAITAGKVIEVVGTTFGEEAWADIHRLVNKVKNEKYLF